MPGKLCFATLLVSSLLLEQSFAQEYLSNHFGTGLAAELASEPATRATVDVPNREKPLGQPLPLVRPAVHETPDRYVGSVQQASHVGSSGVMSAEQLPIVEPDADVTEGSVDDRQSDESSDRYQGFPTLDLTTKSRKSGSSPAPSTQAMGSVVTVISSLAVVLGLFFITAWLMRRTGPAGLAALPTDVFETLGRAQLNNRQQVHLVRCGAKLLLVSVTPDSAETLTEIDDPDEVTRLAGLCKAKQAGSASAAFRQVLQQFAGQPAEPGFVGRTDSPTTRTPLSSELENLHG